MKTDIKCSGCRSLNVFKKNIIKTRTGINRVLDKIFDIVMLAFCIFSGKKQDFDVFDVKEGLNAA
jgi:predicted nucleic-acid-binding Zn-ribbon protein